MAGEQTENHDLHYLLLFNIFLLLSPPLFGRTKKALIHFTQSCFSVSVFVFYFVSLAVLIFVSVLSYWKVILGLATHPQSFKILYEGFTVRWAPCGALDALFYLIISSAL